MASVISAEEARTLPGLMLRRIALSGDERGYRYYDRPDRTWRDLSWREMGALIARYRAAMDALGLDKGDRVAILLPNSVEWVAFDIAAMSLGLVVVPLYAHDSPANHVHVLNDSGARLALFDTPARWELIGRTGRSVPDLSHIWVADRLLGSKQEADDAPLAEPMRKLSELLPNDAAAADGIASEEVAVAPGDIATLIYTSGTTGPPKGVMLTHHAILWDAEGVTKFITPASSDTFLSFLPLAHAFERTLGYYLPIMGGATVAYARSIELLRRDLVSIRPTIFLAVPRLYERIHAGVLEQVEQSALRKVMLDMTIDIGWRDFEWRQGRGPRPGIGGRLAGRILDRLVAAKVRSAFGGRIRASVSGGAALSDQVSRFLIGLGLPLVQGYGLTEAAPVVTATTLDDSIPGSVGMKLHGAELRLAGGGELQVRAPSVMTGYWNDPEATASVLDAEGWLSTGDLADIRDGRVFIRGRVKDILVLSTGENINPGQIADALLKDPLFDQVCVIGDDRPSLAAVLVLGLEEWNRMARDLSIDTGDPNAREAKAAVQKHIDAALADLPRIAQVKRFHLELEPWTPESGLLTPTLKIKSHQIARHFAAELDALYATRVAA